MELNKREIRFLIEAMTFMHIPGSEYNYKIPLIIKLAQYHDSAPEDDALLNDF